MEIELLSMIQTVLEIW